MPVGQIINVMVFKYIANTILLLKIIFKDFKIEVESTE